MLLLNELTHRDRVQNERYSSVDAKIYIKTIDQDFLESENIIDDEKIKIINYDFFKNEFEEKLIDYEPIGIFHQNFNANIYREIEQNIEKINIKNLNQLINDPYAQKILRLDTLGMHELFYFLADKTESESFDAKSDRKLSIGDLANGLLMIIYGQDYWQDTIYPAPISRIYDLKFEQLIAALDWKKLTANQKKQAFKDDEYLKFISHGWYMSVSDMSFFRFRVLY